MSLKKTCLWQLAVSLSMLLDGISSTRRSPFCHSHIPLQNDWPGPWRQFKRRRRTSSLGQEAPGTHPRPWIVRSAFSRPLTVGVWTNLYATADYRRNPVCLLPASMSCQMLIRSVSRHSTSVIPTLDPPLRQAAVDSYADALRVVFICQVAINVITLLLTMPIQENPLP